MTILKAVGRDTCYMLRPYEAMLMVFVCMLLTVSLLLSGC